MFLLTLLLLDHAYIHRGEKKKEKDYRFNFGMLDLQHKMYFYLISTGKYFLQLFFLIRTTKPTLTFFNIWC